MIDEGFEWVDRRLQLFSVLLPIDLLVSEDLVKCQFIRSLGNIGFEGRVGFVTSLQLLELDFLQLLLSVEDELLEGQL